MCGLLLTSGLERPFSHVDLASLRSRGPDAIGYWSHQGVNVAQTRLAIVGLDERSNQPVENESHVLAYNGEVYNFEEIRGRLAAEGLLLPGANDAVTLLHAWSRWGRAILADLCGFWAFAVYDKRAQTLTLVRDQLGVKPLYYWVEGQRLCVASTIRAIKEVTRLSPELDYQALAEYATYQFTFGDKTFLKGIRKVLPGHAVEIHVPTGRVRPECYEDIFAPVGESVTEVGDDWVAEARTLLVDSVLRSTTGDVPFSTLCSGGIDSSLLTTIARPEIAYHGNYSDPDCNETFFARRVVEGTSTRLFVVNAAESFDLVARLSSIVEDFDDLTVGAVVLPLDDLFGQIKRRHKVVLSGTGGDELFGGYVRYQLAMGDCFQDSYREMYERMSTTRTVFDRFELSHRKGDAGYYRFDVGEAAAEFRKAYYACDVGDGVGTMLGFDRRYFLPALLNIDDRIAGRHSLEVRPSMLSQPFVRMVAQLDPRTLIGEVELKSLLRRIAEPLLPSAVVHRSDKMGFTTPIGTFVHESADRVREQLTTSPFRDLYDLTSLNFATQGKFSRQVFGLLMLDLWLNRYAVG